MNELDLRRVLSAAVADEPPLQRSPDDVLATARRIVAIRTTGAWAGAAVVAAVLVASVAIVGKTPGGQPHARAGEGGAAGAASASRWPSSLPPTVGPGPRTSSSPLVPGSTLLATLLSLLPRGTRVVSKDGRSNDTASAVLSDSQGRVLLLVDVSTLTDDSLAQAVFTCATRGLPAGTQCNAWTRPDGTRVITTDGPNEDQNRAQIRQREVDVLTPTGSRITLNQFNSEQEKDGPVSRPALLLTLDQMQTIALNPAWRQRQ